jgi:hypothetical protein
MSAVWNALDNREKALLIWSVLLFGGALLMRDVRRSVPGIMAILVTPPLSLLLFGAVLYVSAIIVVAAELGLWTLPLVGVTVLWFLGPGMVMFFNAHAAVTDPAFFRKALRGGVWLILIVEGVVNLAVFPLTVELIAVPLVLLVVLLVEVAKTKPEFAQVKTIMEFVLSVLVVAFVARTAHGVITGFEGFATLETLMRVLLPPVLTIAFLGYVYLLRLYMIWEHRRLHLAS